MALHHHHNFFLVYLCTKSVVRATRWLFFIAFAFWSYWNTQKSKAFGMVSLTGSAFGCTTGTASPGIWILCVLGISSASWHEGHINEIELSPGNIWMVDTHR